MSKPHALTVSLMVGTAAVAGIFAVSRTISLGQASTTTPQSTIEARQAALDRAEAQITRLRASRPPALPDRPTAVRAAVPRVVYVRAPQPRVAAGEREHEGDEDHGEEAWDD